MLTRDEETKKYQHNWYLQNKEKILIRGKKWKQKYPWKRTLSQIKQRCYNTNNIKYKDWGGRGIKCLITSEELKQLWFRDKAYLLNKPSIDRKDNNGNYTLKNCRYIELSENCCRNHRKKINQYDLDGIFIREWKSGRIIQRILGIANTSISSVCLGKRKSAGGFIWKFQEVNDVD